MSTIRPLEDIPTGLAVPKSKSPLGDSELGQEDFLRLMIEQFRNQDPMKPMENGDFLGQIAQFSTVSGIEDLNAGFATLATSMQDEQALKASSLVGRSVVAFADQGYLGAGEPLKGSVELEGFASNVQVDIKDASGELVQRLNLGEQAGGIVNFTWDGTDTEGQPRSEGNYAISARMIRGNQVENVETLVEAHVNSVTLGRHGQGMTLNLEGGGEMSLNKIHRIN